MNPIARMMKRYIKMPLKKALPLLFIGALVLVATTGCTTQNTTQSSGGGTGQSSGNPLSVSIVPMGTAMQVGEFNTPKSGYQYVSYNVTVKNNNAPDQDMNPLFFSLRTSDGKVFDPDSAMYDQSVNGFQSASNTQPGDHASGTIIFQIPTGATPSSITYYDYSHKITTTL
jgi:hypothetical protein